MKITAALLSLLVSTSAMAETVMVPVADLLFQAPQFTNAPRFSLNEALHGQWTPQAPQRLDRKTRRELERRLIDFMWEQYPDAVSIRIWQGHLIINLPEEANEE